MDVEILLHGVPSGQDYFGIKEEQKLAESFYTSSNESVKLVVEARKNGNTPYVYYTYLRYKNIVGAGGRSGSYIGITLRLDMYYTDVVHMYNMLDIAFKKYIIGALLTSTGESYKYISPDFNSKKSEIFTYAYHLVRNVSRKDFRDLRGCSRPLSILQSTLH